MFLLPSLKLGSYKLNFAHKLLLVINFQNIMCSPLMAMNMDSRIRLPEFKACLCHYNDTIGKLLYLFVSQFPQL